MYVLIITNSFSEERERYKEGRVILEKALVTEMDGIEELIPDDLRKTD